MNAFASGPVQKTIHIHQIPANDEGWIQQILEFLSTQGPWVVMGVGLMLLAAFWIWATKVKR